MVTHEWFEIRVRQQCASCGTRVRPGDLAWLAVSLPEGKADTICPACWTVMLGAAMMWLGQNPDSAQVAMDWALARLREQRNAKNDPGARKAPA